jgi:hypothetical protein
MDADTPPDLRLADARAEETRRLEAPVFQVASILFHPGWMSHAPQDSRPVPKCHYVL